MAAPWPTVMERTVDALCTPSSERLQCGKKNTVELFLRILSLSDNFQKGHKNALKCAVARVVRCAPLALGEPDAGVVLLDCCSPPLSLTVSFVPVSIYLSLLAWGRVYWPL